MKATALEFRLRFWILVAIYALGFTAPWDRWLPLDGSGPNTHVWGRLAIGLSRAGMDIAVAFRLVLIAGIALALAAAVLRTWASACLGPEVMRDSAMHGEAPAADGPYRYMRNPLYVGSWLNALALALLMPPSGAIFTLALLVVFQLRLILAEEAFLRERLGQAYAEYCARVPRFVPRLPAASPNRDVGRPRRWGQAALAEIFLAGRQRRSPRWAGSTTRIC